MADTKISALTDGVTLDAGDRIPVARSPYGVGDNRYVVRGYFVTYFNTLYDALGAATAAVAAHEAAGDPHPQYLTAAEGDALFLTPAEGDAAYASLVHATRHQDGGADEIVVTGLSGLLADAQKVTVRKNTGVDVGTRKRLNLIEGTNITLTVADDAVDEEVDVTITSTGGGGSANIKQTEVDFGAIPIAETEFTITDVDVSPTSQLVGTVAYEAPTGKDLDEMEMDAIDLKFQPGTGDFTLRVKGLEGYLHDKFKINYLVG